ncbi:terminase large subunit [uncultured archaeal virus]|uniref:Terminase large subunit n=1 Tax=uncultured archaeal virus TaxID=1960247 RepID=A0A1S5Y314_9VIRU|nr:terminase large subunit [uncultured archaeal virus]
MDDIERLRELARKYPVKFCNVISKAVLGRELYDYQAKFIADTNRRICFVSGRQIGKTTATALKALVFAFTEDDKVVLILSKSLRQSKIMFERIRMFLLAIDALADYTFRMTINEIQLKNGSRIYCIPVGRTAEAARGYTADMIIADEAAYVPDLVFEAMMPSLAVTGGYLLLLGTPGGKTGFFYRAWMTEEGWSKYRVTCYDCPRIPKEFIEEYRHLVTEARFKREILAEFVEVEDMFFPIPVIEDLMVLPKRYSKPQKGFRYIAGLDIARHGKDETVLAIVGIAPDGHYELHAYYRRAKSTITQIVKFVLEKMEHWNVEKLIVDITGMGVGSYDILREFIPKSKLKGITMSVKKKKDLYDNLLKLIENHKIYFFEDDMLIEQFSNFEIQSHSVYGIIAKKGSGRDDIVDAIALAVYGAKKGGTFHYLKRSLDRLAPGGFLSWLAEELGKRK